MLLLFYWALNKKQRKESRFRFSQTETVWSMVVRHQIERTLEHFCLLGAKIVNNFLNNHHDISIFFML